MRLRNGTGATALAVRATRAGLCCGAILTNGIGPARVGQQWRSLGARCNGWIERLQAPQARGVTGLWPGKPLVHKYSQNFKFTIQCLNCINILHKPRNCATDVHSLAEV